MEALFPLTGKPFMNGLQFLLGVTLATKGFVQSASELCLPALLLAIKTQADASLMEDDPENLLLSVRFTRSPPIRSCRFPAMLPSFSV
jgi:hypothetical protein